MLIVGSWLCTSNNINQEGGWEDGKQRRYQKSEKNERRQEIGRRLT